MKYRLRIIMALLFVCLVSVAGVRVPVYAETVRVVHVDGDINAANTSLVKRSLADAEAQGDAALIVSLDSSGGSREQAVKISDLLTGSAVPTIAYVSPRARSVAALVALSCRHIVMAPGGSIGASDTESAKDTEELKGKFGQVATTTGKNPRLIEAMTDKSLGYSNYAEPGQLLTLSDTQAKAVNLSDGTADSIDGVLHLYSLDNASVQDNRLSLRDMFFGILQNELARVLLVALLLSAFAVEIKTGGIGAGFGLAVISGALLLSSGDGTLADSLKLAALLVLGAVFVGIELLTPTVGIFGFLGTVMIFASLFFILGSDMTALFELAGAVVCTVVFLAFVGSRLPQSRLLAKVTLKNRSTRESGYESQTDKSDYIGKNGTTLTPLRPAGTVRIDKKRVDAVSRGDYIDKDVPVRVIEAEGMRVVVETIESDT